MRFATADTHFWHTNIIKYENRPYNSIQAMNEGLISRWNSVVSDNDDIYILGDFVWAHQDDANRVRKIIAKLNGIKHLILGNHDELKPFTYVSFGIASVHTMLDIGDYILTHDPAVAVVKKDRKWLCGHVHSLFKECGNVVNVGVDVRNYYPMEIK